jgi:hypothetical protein
MTAYELACLETHSQINLSQCLNIQNTQSRQEHLDARRRMTKTMTLAQTKEHHDVQGDDIMMTLCHEQVIHDQSS